MYLRSHEAVLTVATRRGKDVDLQTLRFGWLNSQTSGVSGEFPTGGASNYLTGNDKKSWKTGIPHFAHVRYHNLYPGIDAVYYGKDGELEYDLVLAPGADASVVRLGIAGASRTELRNGDLVLHTPAGEVVQHKPVAYQQVAGIRRSVDSRYKIAADGTVTFELGNYDRSQELIIDPTVSYSRLFGGTGSDEADAIAVDSTGNIYVAGLTVSTDLPQVSPLTQAQARGNTDAFVMKLNAAGNTVLFSTYIGGSLYDAAHAVAVDSSNYVYVVGETGSGNFPAFAPMRSTLGGSQDAFLMKITPAGSGISYSTYIGGTGAEVGRGVALDTSNNAYVVGTTTSLLFHNTPTVMQRSGTSDMFMCKVRQDAIEFGRFLGGNGADNAYGVVFKNNALYVVGDTTSSDPTWNSLQSAPGGGTDAVVVKTDTSGVPAWYAYYGGANNESARAVGIDGFSNLYIAGVVSTGGFPVKNALQGTYGGGANDGFVVSIDATTPTSVRSATYLGGAGDDAVQALSVDPGGAVYVAGYTNSPNLPVAGNLKTSGLGSTIDAFVTKYSARLGSYLYSTYLGGTGTDRAYGIASDISGAYVTGLTLSGDFTGVSGTLQGQDAFMTKLVSTCTYSVSPTPLDIAVSGGSQVITVNAGSECSWTATTSDSFITLSANPYGAGTGTFSITVAANTGAANRTGTVKIGSATLTVNQLGTAGCSYQFSPSSISIGNTATSGSVQVIPNSQVCSYTASASPFIQITSGGSGTGTGTISYTVSALTGTTPRSGFIVVGGASFTITQNARSADAVGTFNAGTWRIDMAREFAQTNSNNVFAWGTAGWKAVYGDWNGDGKTKVGVFKDGVWILDVDNDRQFTSNDMYFQWGNAGDKPVVGDWNGDGKTKVGIFTAGSWYIDVNGNHQLDPAEAFAWGPANGVPMVGDWNGDHKTKVASYDPSNGVWIIDYNGDKQYQAGSDPYIQWGAPGFTPVVGNFFGLGRDTIGAYYQGAFYLESGDYLSNAGDQIISFSNATNATPVVGDWSGDGKTKVGVFNGNQFTIDYNGDGVINSSDKQFTFGTAGDTPVVGKFVQ